MSCFPTGTLVRTPQGDRPIDQMKLDEAIMAFDVDTNSPVAGNVRRVDLDSDPFLLDVTFEDGDILTTSPSQRFWNFGSWSFSGSLKSGHVLAKHPIVRVVVRPWEGPVHTLVVEDAHNYLVLSREGKPFVAHDNSVDFGFPGDFPGKAGVY